MIYRKLRYVVLTGAFCMFLFSFLFSACNLLDPSPEATVVRPPELNCDDLVPLTGEEIYRCKCASCHGIDGVPATDQITDIRGFTPFAKFETSLNTGPASMPEFPEIELEERQRLFEYVQNHLGE
ncbi:MAG: cytochrome c [Ignavibacteriae bacterium]|nr:cytochrome c [Ignavibacteriota bacterium]MCB9214747.1 cytochrome c [Ignavibacteria bacterium]